MVRKKIAEHDKEKADVLASFFSSVFTSEPDGEAPTMENVPVEHQCQDRPFNAKEISKLLLELEPNKSPGPDELHPVSLKALANTMNKPLEIIYNTSLKTGKVPGTWKAGNITALFKKGEKSDPGTTDQLA